MQGRPTLLLLFVIAVGAYFLLGRMGDSGSSTRDELISGYALGPIVDATEKGDPSAFINLMEKSNLCRPVREPAPECASATYVDAVRLHSLHTSPNLWAADEIHDWLEGTIGESPASLALVNSSAEGVDKTLLLIFRLEQARAPGPANPWRDGLMVWATLGRPSQIEQVWWTNVNEVIDVLDSGHTAHEVIGSYHNVIFCDEDVVARCPGDR